MFTTADSNTTTGISTKNESAGYSNKFPSGIPVVAGEKTSVGGCG